MDSQGSCVESEFNAVDPKGIFRMLTEWFWQYKPIGGGGGAVPGKCGLGQIQIIGVKSSYKGLNE